MPAARRVPAPTSNTPPLPDEEEEEDEEEDEDDSAVEGRGAADREERGKGNDGSLQKLHP